jgi:hypothetical protein
MSRVAILVNPTNIIAVIFNPDTSPQLNCHFDRQE